MVKTRKAALRSLAALFFFSALLAMPAYGAEDGQEGESVLVLAIGSNIMGGTLTQYSLSAEGIIEAISYQEFKAANAPVERADGTVIIKEELIPGTTPYFFKGLREGDVEVVLSRKEKDEKEFTPIITYRVHVNADKTLFVTEVIEN